MKDLITVILLLLAQSSFAGDEAQYGISLKPEKLTRAQAEDAFANQVATLTTVSGLDAPLTVVKAPLPAYPSVARRTDVQGKVRAVFLIEPDGSVSDVKVIGAQPPHITAETVKALSAWRFAPITKDGMPVRLKIEQAFVYMLE